MLRTIRSQVSLILLGILLLTLSSVALTYRRTEDHHDDHNAMSVVVLQRELVQRMALVAISDPQSEALEDLFLRFDNSLLALERGGAIDLSSRAVVLSPEDDPLVHQQLQATSESWSIFRDGLRVLNGLSSADPGYVDAVQTVQADIPILLDDLDAITEQFDEHMNRELEELKRIQGMLIAAAGALLVISLIILRRRIVRPSAMLTAYTHRGSPSVAPLGFPDEAYDDELEAFLTSFEALRAELEAVKASTAFESDLQAEKVATAFTMSQEIIGASGMDDLVPLVTAKAEQLLDAHSSALCLVEPSGSLLELVSAHGRIAADISFPHEESSPSESLQVIGRMPASGAHGLCKDCHFFEACRDENTLTVPLEVGQRSIGAICVVREDRHYFTPGEMRALQLLANTAAIAISNARLSELSRIKVRQEAIDGERQRLAADLHDNLAQTLGYLQLRAERARTKLEATEQVDALKEIDEIRSATSSAYGQVRTVLNGLSDALNPPMAARRELQDFIADLVKTAGLEIDASIEDAALGALSPRVQLQVLHIVREALTNVRRHAHARRVTVRVTAHRDATAVSVEDDGVGFDPAAIVGNHLGLAIMSARAERSGGRLTVESKVGKGSLVLAVLPHLPLTQEERVN